MGLHCPFCKKEEEGMEDWNSDRQESQQRNHYPQNLQHPQTYDIPDRFSQQIRLEKEWNEEDGASKQKILLRLLLQL